VRLVSVAGDVGGAGGADVVGRVALDLGADNGVGQLGDLPQDPLEHLLLVVENRGCQGRGLIVTDRTSQLLDSRVGRDLQRLGGARVPGVLEDLLLAA
jgi:hypothetical protein